MERHSSAISRQDRQMDYGQRWGECASRCFSIEGDFLDDSQITRLMPLPESFFCPISTAMMVDPVATVDGSAYEREHIERWFRERRQQRQAITSPATGLELASTTLMPLLALQRAIETYLAHRPEIRRDLMAGRSYEEAAQVLQADLFQKAAMAVTAHDEIRHLHEANRTLLWELRRSEAMCASLTEELRRTREWARNLEDDKAATLQAGLEGRGHRDGNCNSSNCPSLAGDMTEFTSADEAAPPSRPAALSKGESFRSAASPGPTGRPSALAALLAAGDATAGRGSPQLAAPLVKHTEQQARLWPYMPQHLIAALIAIAVLGIASTTYPLRRLHERTTTSGSSPFSYLVFEGSSDSLVLDAGATLAGAATDLGSEAHTQQDPSMASGHGSGSGAWKSQPASDQSVSSSSRSPVHNPSLAGLSKLEADSKSKGAPAPKARQSGAERSSSSEASAAAGAIAGAGHGIAKALAAHDASSHTEFDELLHSRNPLERRAAVVGLLQTVAAGSEQRARVLRSGTMKFLVKMLEDQDEEFQELAAAAVGALAVAGGAETQAAAARAGVIPAIVKLLQVESKLLQRAAAAALRNLAAGHDMNQRLIVQAGALVPLVKLLQEEGAPNTQAEAAAALGNLAGEDADKQVAIARSGAIPPLVKLLRARTPEVCKLAAGALRMLATDNADNQVTIAQAGAIRSLVRLLKDKTPGVREEAAATLGNLAFYNSEANRGNQVAIAEAGAVRPLVKLLSDEAPAVCESAAGALRNLAAQNFENQDAVMKAGGLAPLIRLLKIGDAAVRAEALGALRNLAASNAENQEAIVRSGAMESLAELVHAEDESLRNEAVGTLWVLAQGNPEVEAAIAHAGGSPKGAMRSERSR